MATRSPALIPRSCSQAAKRPARSCRVAYVVTVPVGRSTKAGLSGVSSARRARSEEHTSELQSLMRISYAVFCLKKKHNPRNKNVTHTQSNNKTQLIHR